VNRPLLSFQEAVASGRV